MTGGRWQRLRANRRGLTLMEIVVVTAVFSVTMVLAIDIFLSISRLQRYSSAQQRVQSDARYVMEAIVRDIRSGTIDYTYYAQDPDTATDDIDLSTAIQTLVIRDPEGNQRRYWLDDTVQKIKFCTCTNDSTSCPVPEDEYLPGCRDDTGAETTQDVTPARVQATSLFFFIGPAQDPFDLTTNTDVQPHATVSIGSTSDDLDDESFDLQTTVVSRAYRR